jgi:hypothetical protein
MFATGLQLGGRGREGAAVELAAAAWFWGLGGAFIYAAPRWIAALVAARNNVGTVAICMLEFAVALAIGAIAAAAFGSLVLETLHLKDENAISAMIGLFANTVSPRLVEPVSTAVANRVLLMLKGGEK